MFKAIVVDDEILNAEHICRLLRKAQVDIVSYYTNPLEALNSIASIKPDVVFLDIEMPGISGLDIAEKLMERLPHIYIVFITAYNNFASEAFEVNAIDYILKPVREERLVATINKISDQISKNEPQKHCSRLYIQAFGKLILRADDKYLKWNRQKSAEVFANLLMNKGRWINKEKLCDDIWGEYEPKKALAYLQTAMCQIRKTLSVFNEGQIKVEFFDNCYRLTLNDACYDVDIYEDFYNKAFFTHNDSSDCMDKMFEIYRGKFLEEEGWTWSITYRETLDIKYKYLLHKLIDKSIENKNWDRLLDYMKALLETADDSEEIFQRYTPILFKVFGKKKAKEWKDSILIF